jgi:Amt family ammonium transporter
VAGLATVTPAAGYIQPWAAVLIGAASGAVCYGAVQVRAKLALDDALDVFGCHGAGGILGAILVGVFATKAVNTVNGALYGNVHQLVVQIFAVVIVGVYTFGLTFGMLKIINIFEPVRVSKEAEILGLDDFIHHEIAYL